MVRITQTLLNDRVLFNLQNNINRLAVIQDQLSTGRRINRPADDPVGFPISLSSRTNIALGRSYLSNINGARTNLDLTETSMNSLTEVMQRIRTLTVQGASDDNDPDARIAIAQQVNELHKQILDLANSNYNGVFIFGGSQTRNTPFVGKEGTILYTGDNFERNVTISQNTKVTSNVTGLQTFIHAPNTVTGSVSVQDTKAPLAQQLRLAHPDYPNLPPLPQQVPGASVDGSPNPANSPTISPNNYANFSIYGTTIRVDLSVDSLEDVVTRINNKIPDVNASIDEKNRLVIRSNRADELKLSDGSRDIGFPAEAPFGSNFLAAMGMHRRVENGRSLTLGFPAADPLTNGTVLPTPDRSTVRVQEDSFLFVNTNTGPATQRAVPFADNLAISNVDEEGNEQLDANDNPVFIDELQAIRITIDDKVYDVDLRGMTRGMDFDGIPGNGDDLPGSTLGDMINIINNHPALKGEVTAYINAAQTGIGITATHDTDVFKVESVRKLFGRDLTTSITVDPLTGRQTITRTPLITAETKLDDLPGALVDPLTGDSEGIRRGQPIPGIDLPSTNFGIISIQNNGDTFSVDLRDTETVGDVLRLLNESKAGIKAEINEFGTGINITSRNGLTDVLSIQDVNDGTTARDLGLFVPPTPRRIQSNNPAPLTGNELLSAGGVAPNMADGTFQIEIRDNSGATLDTYTINAAATDSVDELIRRIDEIDGEGGAGGGLFSAYLDNGRITVVSNYNGHNIVIDPANDTTGVDANTRLTSQLGIDRYSVTDENEVPQGIYRSDQRTAEILGVGNDSTLNEVEEQNIFRTLSLLEDALRNDNTAGIQQALEDIDFDLSAVLNTRTTLGSRLNRLDAAQVRLEEGEDLVRQQLSLVEDADLSQVITDLTLAQNAFDAALQAAGRIIQQSLINFL